MRNGFTLIELLIVVAIIAILAQGLAAAPSWVYDSTNGTISRGDIFRSAIQN